MLSRLFFARQWKVSRPGNFEICPFWNWLYHAATGWICLCSDCCRYKNRLSWTDFSAGRSFSNKCQEICRRRRKGNSDGKEFNMEAIEAGFYNIDIDTSTLVDLTKETRQGTAKNKLQSRSRAYNNDTWSGTWRRYHIRGWRDRGVGGKTARWKNFRLIWRDILRNSKSRVNHLRE